MDTELLEKREIVSPEHDTDFTEYQIARIADAICEGHQLQYFGSKEREANSGTPIRQSCLTVYTEPTARVKRYAVESWNGWQSWKWDFGTRPAASKHFLAECDRLGI